LNKNLLTFYFSSNNEEDALNQFASLAHEIADMLGQSFSKPTHAAGSGSSNSNNSNNNNNENNNKMLLVEDDDDHHHDDALAAEAALLEECNAKLNKLKQTKQRLDQLAQMPPPTPLASQTSVKNNNLKNNNNSSQLTIPSSSTTSSSSAAALVAAAALSSVPASQHAEIIDALNDSEKAQLLRLLLEASIREGSLPAVAANNSNNKNNKNKNKNNNNNKTKKNNNKRPYAALRSSSTDVNDDDDDDDDDTSASSLVSSTVSANEIDDEAYEALDALRMNKKQRTAPYLPLLKKPVEMQIADEMVFIVSKDDED